FAGADQQARRVRAPRDDERIGGGLRRARRVHRSAPAHRDDDLETIAVREHGVGIAAARNDLAGALDVDALAAQLDVSEQLVHASIDGGAAGLTVHGKLNHVGGLGGGFDLSPWARAASGGAVMSAVMSNCILLKYIK